MMYGSVMFHMAAMLPMLREMSEEQVTLISDEANQHSMEFPLHAATDKDKFSVPSWKEDKLSGMQVVALMVASLWILCKEDASRCQPLVDKWPIREAVLLSNKPPQHHD
jgi:hypothetical protein